MTEVPPLTYPDWRTDEFDRAEDAAYAFGYYLVRHCRQEALDAVPEEASPESRAAAEEAVDVALHNVMDMLEGFWRLDSGPAHRLELVLQVRVHDSADTPVEAVEVSPAKLDLPIGYWKWVREGVFRASA